MWPVALACLLAALILAGCGGSGRSDRQQTVGGAGFRFQAPAAWTVAKAGASVAASPAPGSVDRVEVLRFKLEKPYRVALFAATVRELDGVVARLAGQLSGRVASRTTVQLAGRKSRSYRVVYGPGKSQEIAFVLQGQTEYEVLCRRPSSQSDATCKAFFSSFALG